MRRKMEVKNVIDTESVRADDVPGLKKLLQEKHAKISSRKIKALLNKIETSQQTFPDAAQQALLILLLNNYESTKKKEVIFLEELKDNDTHTNRGDTKIPVTFVLGAVAEDWPGMSNSILGIVHHKKRNVLFMKGFTMHYRDRTLGFVILSFRIDSREEYENFLQEKKELISEIKDASHGSTGKYRLLDDEAVKAEIYNKILRRIKEMHHNPELVRVIEESGETLKFVSARSREYLEERKIKDLANLVITNYIAQNSVRCGETEEVTRIRNFKTNSEELTGLTFVCKEGLFSIEDFLKTLDHIVPGHIIRHHKSYITRDGILVYRIEIVDRNDRPLDAKLIKSLEISMDKLITISCSNKFTKLKSVGGIEHYARAIIPFLSEELKNTKLTQVFINVDSKTEFLIHIKLIIVSFKAGKTRIYSLISRLSLVPGIDISSSIPPKIHHKKIEIDILKLKVNLSEFSSIREIYNSIKDIVKKIYGDIRDFDEGFRDIYIKILNQLLEQLETVDAALIREIYFNIDELYRIEISPGLLLELIRLCADSVEESREIPGEKVLFKYKHIPTSNRTLVVVSYTNHKRLLSRLTQKLRGVTLYFTKIEWEQRSYMIMILSKNNRVVEDSFIQQLKDKINAADSREIREIQQQT
jgi:hypothetical protein